MVGFADRSPADGVLIAERVQVGTEKLRGIKTVENCVVEDQNNGPRVSSSARNEKGVDRTGFWPGDRRRERDLVDDLD